MPAQQPACLFRTVASAPIRAILLGCAVWLAAAGPARAEAPLKFEVQTPTVRFEGGTTATFRISNGTVADKLNEVLSPLAWADRACDREAYTRLHDTATWEVGQAVANSADADRAELQKIFDTIPAPRGLRARWLHNFCGKFLLDKGANFDPKPRHALTARVPCLVLMRANDKDILWCQRTVLFYNALMKTEAEARLERVRGIFMDCAGPDRLEGALKELGQTYDVVLSRHFEGRGAALNDAVVDEYDLRRRSRPRVGLAPHLVGTDRDAARSLAAHYLRPRYDIWCSPVLRQERR